MAVEMSVCTVCGAERPDHLLSDDDRCVVCAGPQPDDGVAHMLIAYIDDPDGTPCVFRAPTLTAMSDEVADVCNMRIPVRDSQGYLRGFVNADGTCAPVQAR
jgi:hypothetical protein